ncbi:hypothetical protein CYY_001979 [Polysphondylium violaceum]|uniref:Tubulin-specific chaperone A n=1 Tax=Polysphondylium violaceum TaxID=133409 RepID=A0A8J4Q235_9MYCE|nr:hypothetical protein CYY_001979 [Polysphondylium violaceum]
MSSTTDIKKALKIKMDSLKRLENDYNHYRKEEIQQMEVIQRFKADKEKDIYDVKKQEEILDENKRMIIDSVTRIISYIFSFMEYLDDNGDSNDGSEIWNDAIGLIERLSDTFITNNPHNDGSIITSP